MRKSYKSLRSAEIDTSLTVRPNSAVKVSRRSELRLTVRNIRILSDKSRNDNELCKIVQTRTEREQWHLKCIQFICEDPEVPVLSDNLVVVVEQGHRWLIPPAWEFYRRGESMNGNRNRRSCMTMRDICVIR